MFAGNAVECGFSRAEVIALVGRYALLIFCGHGAVVRSVGGGRLRLRDLGTDVSLRVSHVRATLDVVEFLRGRFIVTRVECFHAVGESIVIAPVLACHFLRHDVAVLLRVFVGCVFLRGGAVETRGLRDVSLSGCGLRGLVEIFFLAGEGGDRGKDKDRGEESIDDRPFHISSSP